MSGRCPRSRARLVLLALLPGAVLTACSKQPATEAELLKAGITALHAKLDCAEAAAIFRRMLEANQARYAATVQLATALDCAGLRDEATRYWEQVLAMAEASRDRKTAAAARARLEQAAPRARPS
jgi:tetratricopeptide (TPR) repeat protein